MTHVTTEALDSALAYIQEAPKNFGPIETLCFRPDFGERVFSESLALSVANGVDGDRWKSKPWLTLEDGSADPRIQVCILGKRVLDSVWLDRENTPYPGDTIIADLDFSEVNFPNGALIRAGTAILRVSDVFNDACVKWKVRYGVESVRWINRVDIKPLRMRGVLCEIVENGEVSLNDRLEKLSS